MFKGLGNLANLGSLVKQAQEMGEKMQQVNEALKLERVTGNAGAGFVEVEVNGLGEVLAVRIDKALVEKQDHELIDGFAAGSHQRRPTKSQGTPRGKDAGAHRRYPNTGNRPGSLERFAQPTGKSLV